jgi:hypothetical protein
MCNKTTRSNIEQGVAVFLMWTGLFLAILLS